jgi:hypothetical protein
MHSALGLLEAEDSRRLRQVDECENGEQQQGAVRRVFRADETCGLETP